MLLDVLSQMLTPPPPSAIMSSVDSLSSLGALDADEALTALGRLLSQIPMDPRLAKTCIFACMLRSALAHTFRHQFCCSVLLYTDRPLACLHYQQPGCPCLKQTAYGQLTHANAPNASGTCHKH